MKKHIKMKKKSYFENFYSNIRQIAPRIDKNVRVFSKQYFIAQSSSFSTIAVSEYSLKLSLSILNILNSCYHSDKTKLRF